MPFFYCWIQKILEKISYGLQEPHDWYSSACVSSPFGPNSILWVYLLSISADWIMIFITCPAASILTSRVFNHGIFNSGGCRKRVVFHIKHPNIDSLQVQTTNYDLLLSHWLSLLSSSLFVILSDLTGGVFKRCFSSNRFEHYSHVV